MSRIAKRRSPAPTRTRSRSSAVKSWTKDDVKQLMALAGTMPKARIARKLRRSEAAVTFKAFKLRVSLAQRARRRARR